MLKNSRILVLSRFNHVYLTPGKMKLNDYPATVLVVRKPSIDTKDAFIQVSFINYLISGCPNLEI